MGCYYHIEAVVKNGEMLAQKYGADKEVKIALVQACVRNHRGSILLEKNCIEEVCVADADAISHFDNVPSLLHLAFVEKKLGLKEGTEYVKRKLGRSFDKLSSESKIFYQDKYRIVMEVLQ